MNTLILGICLMVAAMPALRAQPVDLNPLLMQEGIETARVAAIATFANDAVPTFIGAVGNSTYDFNGNIIPLRFYLEDGRSTSWAYSFYSPSLKQWRLLAVVDIPSVGMQVFTVASPVAIPDVTAPLDTALPYFGSDAAIARLKADSVYTRYRAELPAMLPQGIALQAITSADSMALPQWFPLGRPIWVMRFAGDAGAGMVCYVATGTGATYCVRATVASAPAALEPGARLDLSRIVPLRIFPESGVSEPNTSPAG